MSGCTCRNPTNFRVTGEVWDGQPNGRVHGDGEKVARVRCADCGGKYGYVGSELLGFLGIEDSEIRNGRVLDEEERPTLEVDLC